MKKLILNYLDDFTRANYEEIAKKNYLSEKELKIINVKNGIILPVMKTNNHNLSKGLGGVIDEKLSYVKESAQIAYKMKNRVYGGYSIDLNKVEFINETVIYINYFYKHWGHFIIDIISRLWFILTLDKIDQYKIVFTTNINEKMEINGNYKEFLTLFGIPSENIIILNKPTKFKEIIVPECSIYPGKYYTKEYVSIFNQVIKNVSKKNNMPKKLYLSRAKFQLAKSKEMGEKPIEKFFNKNGYISISPELLTLSEQIQYLNGCEEIVCVSGTLSHNIMFTDKEKSLVIINKTYKINKHQELINQAKGGNVTYIDSHISLFPIAYGKGPFILNISKNLKQFAKDRNYKLQRSHFTILKKFYKKIWYIIVYIKRYNFKIYDDKETNWKELFKTYILR